jgi:hypothetical protein
MVELDRCDKVKAFLAMSQNKSSKKKKKKLYVLRILILMDLNCISTMKSTAIPMKIRHTWSRKIQRNDERQFAAAVSRQTAIRSPSSERLPP